MFLVAVKLKALHSIGLIKLFLLLIFTSLVINGKAQILYNYKIYGLGEGLPSMQVTSVVHDKKGFIWCGTTGGLSRFDGYTFTNFTLSSGLNNNFINVVTPDPADNIIRFENNDEQWSDKFIRQ